MSKCKVCGTIGEERICPVCGTPREEIVKDVAKSINSVTSNKVYEDSEERRVKVIEQCKKSVAKVYAQYTNGSAGHGTGWCGESNFIITNAHVVTSEGVVAECIRCGFLDDRGQPNNSLVLMKPVYISTIDDIAVLAPLNRSLPNTVIPLTISRIPTKQGETVFTIGNPEHYNFTYISGEVSNPTYFPAGNTTGPYGSLQTTITLNCGNSGGPVFNSRGHVVGMATYSETKKEIKDHISLSSLLKGEEADKVIDIREIQGYGFCVKSEAILDAIEIAKVKMGVK